MELHLCGHLLFHLGIILQDRSVVLRRSVRYVISAKIYCPLGTVVHQLSYLQIFLLRRAWPLSLSESELFEREREPEPDYSGVRVLKLLFALEDDRDCQTSMRFSRVSSELS